MKAQTEAKLQALRPALLAWYRQQARDLPWRQSRDPYRIWVSEVMLQQTRVETVLRYFEPFLARFPDLEALACADEAEVLAAWSGLGYYRRARLLHRGAQQAWQRHGAVPRDRDARHALAGVGAYTAGAIASIAFDLPEPIVDGNVARVLSRLLALEAPLGSRLSEQALWQAAAVLVQGPSPGDLNQALMELGATVCTPKRPRCLACPARPHCQASATARQAELPVPRRRKAAQLLSCVAVLAHHTDAASPFWLSRSSGTLFGGMWMLPWHAGPATPSSARQALAAWGLEAGALVAKPAAQVQHLLTHRDLRVTVFRAYDVCAVAEASDSVRTWTPASLQHAAAPALTQKLLRAVLPEAA
ncbi:MAG: A/G-specific adenine glycosylase [Polyangiales bacterium]